jgi:fucose 4-O-acetylase-like acetyltransferase
MASERRYDIDWLRVGAVLLLVPYHTAVLFARPYVAYIKAEPNAILEAFAYFMNQWHMALFFLVSGAATWFSLGSRSGAQYAGERVKRLIVPLVFGTLVVVPVQVYLQRLYYHDFSGSYIRFYPHVFDGLYPHGNFTWGQLWFLAYLFVFSLLALPFFLFLRTNAGRRTIEKAAALCGKSGWIFLGTIPLAVTQAAFRARWPGFQNLYNDWANFIFYFTVFCYGYIMCSDAGFTRAIVRQRKIALLMGIVSMAVILTLRQTGNAPLPDYSGGWILYMLLHGFSSWCWLVAFLGLACEHVNRGNRVLAYATEGALPFYILHHAVIVMVAYRVLRWDVGVAGQFCLITVLSLIGVIVVYDVIVRRLPPLRFLFGMKARRRS